MINDKVMTCIAKILNHVKAVDKNETMSVEVITAARHSVMYLGELRDLSGVLVNVHDNEVTYSCFISHVSNEHIFQVSNSLRSENGWMSKGSSITANYPVQKLSEFSLGWIGSFWSSKEHSTLKSRSSVLNETLKDVIISVYRKLKIDHRCSYVERDGVVSMVVYFSTQRKRHRIALYPRWRVVKDEKGKVTTSISLWPEPEAYQARTRADLNQRFERIVLNSDKLASPETRIRLSVAITKWIKQVDFSI